MSGPGTAKRSPRRWLLKLTLGVPLILVGWWFLAWPTKVVMRLSSDIAYIEYRPNIDRKTRRITEPKRIAAFKKWLLSTRRASSLRSAPPMLICELKVRFTDGREESMLISPTRPPLQDGVADAVGDVNGWKMPVRHTYVRDDVRLRWRGHLREGDTRELNDALFVE